MSALLTWAPWILCLVIGMWIYIMYCRVVDEAAARQLEISALETMVGRLVNRTDAAEPTRKDANDPLRDRFVFCERLTEQGHAPTCAWQEAVKVAERNNQEFAEMFS